MQDRLEFRPVRCLHGAIQRGSHIELAPLPIPNSPARTCVGLAGSIEAGSVCICVVVLNGIDGGALGARFVAADLVSLYRTRMQIRDGNAASFLLKFKVAWADPALLETRCVAKLTHLFGPFLPVVVREVVYVKDLLVNSAEIFLPDLIPLMTMPENVRGIISGSFTLRVLAYVRVILFKNVLQTVRWSDAACDNGL